MTSFRRQLVFALTQALIFPLMLLVLLLQERTLPLFDYAFLTLNDGGQSYPIQVGLLPLKVIALSLAANIVLWVADIFGTRRALATALAVGASLFVAFGFIKLLPFLPASPEQVLWDSSNNFILSLELGFTRNLTLQAVGLFAAAGLFMGILNKILKGHLLLIRSLLCLIAASFIAALAEAQFTPSLSQTQWIVLFITRVLQIALVSVLFLPLTYILNLLLAAFAGQDSTKTPTPLASPPVLKEKKEDSLFPKTMLPPLTDSQSKEIADEEHGRVSKNPSIS